MSIDESQARRRRNLALAALAGQAGCVALIVIVIALFTGLWLDAQAGQRGLFTILVLIASVPVSLYLMVRIALAAVGRIDFAMPTPDEREAEEDHG